MSAGGSPVTHVTKLPRLPTLVSVSGGGELGSIRPGGGYFGRRVQVRWSPVVGPLAPVVPAARPVSG
ncbi:hypothetical protein CSOJ01_16023 [Colletotrichum sojae]|uniref:Uncharacterized protein n=1 Tax=Colletotrichum sojae TaxID=2175907 RepID=A0A8H6ILL4_9PEZI|nr:hypothetical protein CSOJ01_16023 [Colletotrichum sojae]